MRSTQSCCGFRCGCERRADVRFSGTGCCADHSLPFTAFLLGLVSGSLYRNIRTAAVGHGSRALMLAGFLAFCND